MGSGVEAEEGAIKNPKRCGLLGRNRAGLYSSPCLPIGAREPILGAKFNGQPRISGNFTFAPDIGYPWQEGWRGGGGDWDWSIWTTLHDRQVSRLIQYLPVKIG